MPTGDPMVKCPQCGYMAYVHMTDFGLMPVCCPQCKSSFIEPPKSYEEEMKPFAVLPQTWKVPEMKETPKTLVVNLLGGPGTGKSSIRGGLFHDLKFRGVDCEEATEFAKDLTWRKSQFSLGNQIHVFGEQHHRIWSLLGQVEVIITDSPLLLTPIYDKRESDTLRKLALEEFNTMWNYNVFLVRVKEYNPNGRNQTETEAKAIDMKIADYLLDNKIPFETFPGDDSAKVKIMSKVLKLIGREHWNS